jgi:hypothetical protein
MKSINAKRSDSKNKSHHPKFKKIKPISIAKCKIFVKCVGIELEFFNLPNNEYKTPLQTRCPKKMEKKHACNFMGTMLLQQIAKPMLQTSKELQNKIPTFFFKLNKTKSDP